MQHLYDIHQANCQNLNQTLYKEPPTNSKFFQNQNLNQNFESLEMNDPVENHEVVRDPNNFNFDKIENQKYANFCQNCENSLDSTYCEDYRNKVRFKNILNQQKHYSFDQKENEIINKMKNKYFTINPNSYKFNVKNNMKDIVANSDNINKIPCEVQRFNCKLNEPDYRPSLHKRKLLSSKKNYFIKENSENIKKKLNKVVEYPIYVKLNSNDNLYDYQNTANMSPKNILMGKDKFAHNPNDQDNLIATPNNFKSIINSYNS